jgi:D,D-heptose 1,7-bisphosphate phosphatase
VNQVVILAGGKGTRLASRLNGRPKPLIDINGVPLLQRQIETLRDQGFDRFIVSVNHQAEQIDQFCKSHQNFGVSLQLVDDGQPLGTAGATLALFDRLDDEFLVVYGDTLFDIDIRRFVAFHDADPGAAATLFAHPNDHPQDSDLLDVDAESRILGIYGYPHPANAWLPNLVNAALYAIRKSSLTPWAARPEASDFAKHLFPKMIGEGHRLRAYRSPEYIKDAGTPERVDKVSRDLAAGRVARASLRHPQQAVFVDRDGTLNVANGYVTSVDQLALIAGVGPAIKRLNEAEWRVVITTNQPIIARGDCSEQQLRQIHNKLETELARDKAMVDAIQYCPHHPDKGFEGEITALKFDCECRKPKIGMFTRAAAELNIDLTRSWVIGDSSVDIAAAAAAGCQSILVETGEAGLDDRALGFPDFVAADFSAAVELLLDVVPNLRHLLTSSLPKPSAGQQWFVGGLSRSGKSTLASALTALWRDAGFDVRLIRLDGWLADVEHRNQGVLGRYQIAKLNALVQSVRNVGAGLVSIQQPSYSRRHRRQIGLVSLAPITDKTIVIWEGVPAIELAIHSNLLINSVFVASDEALRRRRLAREYTSRGMSLAQIDEMIAEREIDEYAPLRTQAAKAAFQIDLATAPMSTAPDSSVAQGRIRP